MKDLPHICQHVTVCWLFRRHNYHSLLLHRLGAAISDACAGEFRLKSNVLHFSLWQALDKRTLSLAVN